MRVKSALPGTLCNEPAKVSLCTLGFGPTHFLISLIMAPTTPPLNFQHKKGFKIPTKNKEVIHELHGFEKVPAAVLQICYRLGESTIRQILNYDAPKQAQPSRTSCPQLLTDHCVDEIIKYCTESWEHCILKYSVLIKELKLPCTPEHL